MPSNQKTFDIVARGIIAQGGPSAGGRGACYYRHPKLPRKCGVGHLIPDFRYKSSLEGKSAATDSVRLAMGPDHNVAFARVLQSVHDTAAFGWFGPKQDEQFMKAWRHAMVNIAKRYHLSAAVLSQ